MFVAGVRVVEFGSKPTGRRCSDVLIVSCIIIVLTQRRVTSRLMVKLATGKIMPATYRQRELAFGCTAKPWIPCRSLLPQAPWILGAPVPPLCCWQRIGVYELLVKQVVDVVEGRDGV